MRGTPIRETLGELAMTIRAVLLDAGHTILEGRPSWFDIWEEALAAFDVTLDREALQRAYARASDLFRNLSVDQLNSEVERQFLREMASHLQVPGREEELAERMHRVLSQVRPEYTAYPEVPGVLAELRRRGYRMAVVSNWELDLPDVLERAGLRDFFDAIVASAADGETQTHPASGPVARAALDAAPQEAGRGGDSCGVDVQGARAAGVAPVLLDRDHVYRTSDVPLIRDLRELLPLLERMGNAD